MPATSNLFSAAREFVRLQAEHTTPLLQTSHGSHLPKGEPESLLGPGRPCLPRDMVFTCSVSHPTRATLASCPFLTHLITAPGHCICCSLFQEH